ncbi:helix-turn-helix domain-containing protein [Aneurinibacillus aneurinilyticus]|uniref:helix-turn-helix domain-containing protein n=1 Tax=Aneurinibacillus aneurinilyticus TaxID=1391 RepID=UPI002E22C230|nr:helix-turn-helix domain-containing protein [Aneurinibacillus aneurinilyticus]
MTKRVSVKIHKLTQNKGISLRERSRLTDIRHVALSELMNQKRQNINLQPIERVAEAFGIKDIREIIDLIDVKE